MKDIITSQHIQRRSSPSLLSSAMKFRVIPENSFIADQRLLPKRKKNPVLEKIKKIYHKPPRPPIFEEIKAPRQKSRRENPLSVGAGALFARKKLLAGLLICLAVGFLALFAAVSYIPDPEPPEDAFVRANINREAFAANLPNGGDEIPLDLAETFAWQSYTVRSGDNVEGIARRFGLSIDAVIASNDMRNVRLLKAGERIRIPNMDGIPYTVKGGDSYSKIAAAQAVPLEAILDANDIQSDDIKAGAVLFIPGAKMDKTELRKALGTFFIWPLAGRITSPFAWRLDPFTRVRSFHAGLDISANTGTAVRASTDGRVSAIGYNSVYGNFVIISHADDYQTMYAHLSRVLIRNGANVSQGTIIARSGNSGRSSGPHLHFSVYKNKRAVNPLDVLNK